MNNSSNKGAWISTIVATFVATVAAIIMNKPMAVLSIVMEELSFSIAQSGMIMSIFALAGLILALPAGIIVQKINAKNTVLLALVFMLAGSIVGAVSTTLSMLLASRFIEGIGMGLVGVAAPAIISTLFPKEKSGAPMGVFAMYMTIGSFFILNISPVLVTQNNWETIWWLTAGLAIVGLILALIFIRMPKIENNTIQNEKQPTIKDALKSKSLVYLGLAYLCFDIVVMFYVPFLPTYIQSLGIEIQTANFLASLPGLIGAIGGIIYGILADKTNKRKSILVFGMGAFALICMLVFVVPSSALIPLIILSGLIVMGFPSIVMSTAPMTITDMSLVGMAMAVIMLAQNLGGFIGPAIYTSLVESSGWAMAGYAMIPVGVLAVFFASKVVIND